ncbi:MAG: hypothetical protein AB9846_03505 [Tenuifilaceae bacterium]
MAILSLLMVVTISAAASKKCRVFVLTDIDNEIDYARSIDNSEAQYRLSQGG